MYFVFLSWERPCSIERREAMQRVYFPRGAPIFCSCSGRPRVCVFNSVAPVTIAAFVGLLWPSWSTFRLPFGMPLVDACNNPLNCPCRVVICNVLVTGCCRRVARRTSILWTARVVTWLTAPIVGSWAGEIEFLTTSTRLSSGPTPFSSES